MSSRFVRAAIVVALAGTFCAVVYLQREGRTRLGDLRTMAPLDQISCASREDLEVVMKDLDNRLLRDPEAPLSLVELARVSLSLGMSRADNALIEKAEQAANRSLRLAPHDNHGAIEVLARVASYRHDFPRAIDLSQELIRANLYVGYEIGISGLLARGKLREARALTTTIGDLELRASTGVLMGLVEESSGNDELAETYFKASLRVPSNATFQDSLWARSILARFYLRRSRLSEASVVLGAIRDCDRDYLYGVVLDGELALANGDATAAAASFGRAFELSRDPRYLRQLASAHRSRGDVQAWRSIISSAITLYDAAASIDPRYHRALHAQALLERADGSVDVERAIELLEQERERRQSPDIMTPLAYAYTSVGRHAEARAIENILMKEGYSYVDGYEGWRSG